MSTNLTGVCILPREKPKKGDPICMRVEDLEQGRWDKLCEIVRQRNSLASKSDILRDVVFGTHGIVNDDDREFLRAGKSSEGLTVRKIQVDNFLTDENQGRGKGKKNA